MKYFENPQTKEVFGYDETDPTQIPYMEKAIEAGYVDVTGAYPTAAMKENDCVNIAKSLIAAADWAMLSDVNLSNREDFVAYRATLRQLILNPVADPVWPTEPTPVWS